MLQNEPLFIYENAHFYALYLDHGTGHLNANFLSLLSHLLPPQLSQCRHFPDPMKTMPEQVNHKMADFNHLTVVFNKLKRCFKKKLQEELKINIFRNYIIGLVPPSCASYIHN